MAENFEDVVKKLGSAVKKPTAAKAPAVLAVQIVDKTGKVIKEEKGAAAAEARREEEKRGKKTNTLLSGILKAMGGGGGGRQRDSRGRFTKGGGGLLAGLGGGATGAGLGAAMGGLGKMIGPAAIMAGVAMAIKDGFAGYFKSEEWGTSKVSSTIAGVIAGTKEGWEGALANAGKWAVTGFGIGFMVGGPLGGLAGGLIGGAIGAILGWIGGEKIAKFFDAVGTWASEKWDIIKVFPGKIWTAIVDTIKGWIGITPEGKLPITVAEDEPKTDWLTSLTEFLIPQWLKDFATDALTTVTGWLGLTEKDNQGKVSTTTFGKLVFGTIGKLAELYMDIVNFFIPQFIKDFVKAPLDTVMTWLGLKKTTEEGEVTTTAFGEKVFGVVAKVVDIFKSIVKRVIGETTYNAIVGFATDPLNYILVNILGWKTAASEATAAGIAEIKKLEEGSFVGFATNIIKRVIGTKTYDAIVSFATNPIDYILVNWLGWKTKEGELTTAGLVAVAKIDEGKISAFWEQLFRKVIGTKTYDAVVNFIKDPIDYIFVNWLKLGSKDDKKKTTGEKAAVIAGTVVGLWESLLTAILPKGVKDFIMSPINWVFGLFGLDKPGDTLATVEEAHGLTIGDKESRTGLFGKILAAIVPDGLMKFFENPLNWLLKTFLGPEILAKIIGGTLEESQSIIKKSAISPAGLFNDILKEIIPEALLDFIESPVKSILKWMGITTDKPPKLKAGGKKLSAPPMSLGDAVYESMVKDNVWTKFIKEPGELFGLSRGNLNDIMGMLGRAKGGPFAKGQPMIVGEMGPEMIIPNQGGQVFNAQRTQQMLQSGMQRDMGGGAGGGITSINTGGNVVSAPTTNYVNNGIAARRPIILAA